LSLTPGDQAAIIGVGVAVLLGGGAGIFKAAGLRGDLNTRWKRRTTLAKSVLVEKAVEELRLLRGQVDGMLPRRPEDFDPTDVIADPASLVTRADQAARYYRTGTTVELDFTRILNLGPAFVVALSATEVAAVALTAYYGELVNLEWVRIAGLVVLGGAALVLVLAISAYIFLQHRLSGAEIDAGTGGMVQGDEP